MAIKFIIQAGEESLENNGGLVLGGKIMSELNLGRRVNGMIIDGDLEPKITNADMLRSYSAGVVDQAGAFERDVMATFGRSGRTV